MYKSSKKVFVWYENMSFVVHVSFMNKEYDVLFTSSSVPLRKKEDVSAAFLREYPCCEILKISVSDAARNVAFQNSTFQFKKEYDRLKICYGTSPAVPGEPIRF